MKLSYGIAALALLASASMAWAVPPNDVNSLPQVSCRQLKFSRAFLERYPRAPAACQDARTYNGENWARFDSRVFQTSADRTTLQFLNTAGTPIETFSIRPRPGATLTMDGNTRKWSDLRPGDKVTLWIPESRMSASPYPGATTEESWALLPPVNQPASEPAKQ